jgi:hypothetical protein
MGKQLQTESRMKNGGTAKSNMVAESNMPPLVQFHYLQQRLLLLHTHAIHHRHQQLH